MLSEIEPHIHSGLFFSKSVKIIQWKSNVFLANDTGKPEYSHIKKLDAYSYRMQNLSKNELNIYI